MCRSARLGGSAGCPCLPDYCNGLLWPVPLLPRRPALNVTPWRRLCPCCSFQLAASHCNTHPWSILPCAAGVGSSSVVNVIEHNSGGASSARLRLNATNFVPGRFRPVVCLHLAVSRLCAASSCTHPCFTRVALSSSCPPTFVSSALVIPSCVVLQVLCCICSATHAFQQHT